jgi:hypothetical protein
VRREFVLEPGSLLVMRGASQRQWQHAVPRTARPAGARINLTFRHVPRASEYDGHPGHCHAPNQPTKNSQ